jgi:uncharacterized heparinase superfamily protein
MLNWLATMCHPDGEIAFFNDAALGIAPAPVELRQYAERLRFSTPVPRERVTALAASGYVRMEAGAAVALLDVAPLGPDYLPAHGHADTLSFELSLYGRRLLVNSGTSCYGLSEERLRQRKTAAHNTVVVDGHDSSEVWGGFRVARRARPFGLRIADGAALEVSCAHDGYRRLPGRATHRREWRLTDGELVVEDRVTGGFVTAEARFHLHPSIAIEERSARSVMLRLCENHTVRFVVENGTLDVAGATWHPGFGRREENICLRVRFERASIRTRIAWQNGR